jgi:peptidyl-prolyl cis-trans isomerase A (cyclophilin A)
MKQSLFILIVAAASFAQTPAPKATPAPAKTAPKAATAPNLLNPSSLNARAPEMYQAKFTTTKGDVVIEVTRTLAPLGADRFYNLVRAGFFTNTTFFRVVPRFIVQFGISPRPDVAKAWENARFADDPVKQSNKRGTITFATAGPNTRTTQLFINYSDNAGLDGQGFAPFGTVIQGMDIVDKIYPGYGEQPDQGRLQAEGKAYTDKSFPMLDKILSASIVPAAAPDSKAAPDTKK